MKGRNVCTFIGNVGQAPEVKYTTTQVARVNFSVAVNKKWSDSQGNPMEKTTWVPCIAWGKTAELIGQYLKKGDPIHIEAEFDINEWTDTDGVKKKTPQFIVQDVIFLGQKKAQPAVGRATSDEDIPF